MYPLPQQSPDRLSYSPNYDKELYDKIRTELTAVYNILVAEAKIKSYLNDPDGLGRISGLFNDMKMLLLTYKEKIQELDVLEIELISAKYYPLQDTKEQKGLVSQFIFIRDTFIEIMAHKHAFMDRVDTKRPWEENFKKKLNLLDIKLDQEQIDWYDKYCDSKTDHKYKKKWRKICFWWALYCVKRKGDICTLVTGINNSGKSNTSVRMLQFTNRIFRECWHIKEDEKQTIELHKFNIDKDVVYDPDPSVLNSLLEEDRFYQTIDITEGMGSATNLQSMDKKVIKLGVKAYRMRYRRDVIIWEYQITERPPKLLVTRFNSWIHKLNWYWGVISCPSSFYRTKDPLYLKRLEDIADNDTKLARWFDNPRQNPNYICKFTTPKLSNTMQAKFDHNMMEADKRMLEKEELQDKHATRYFSIVKDLWKKVNIDNFMVEDQIATELIGKGFNKPQIEKVVKLYSEYDATQKYQHETKQKKVIVSPTQSKS